MSLIAGQELRKHPKLTGGSPFLKYLFMHFLLIFFLSLFCAQLSGQAHAGCYPNEIQIELGDKYYRELHYPYQLIFDSLGFAEEKIRGFRFCLGYITKKDVVSRGKKLRKRMYSCPKAGLDAWWFDASFEEAYKGALGFSSVNIGSLARDEFYSYGRALLDRIPDLGEGDLVLYRNRELDEMFQLAIPQAGPNRSPAYAPLACDKKGNPLKYQNRQSKVSYTQPLQRLYLVRLPYLSMKEEQHYYLASLDMRNGKGLRYYSYKPSVFCDSKEKTNHLDFSIIDMVKDREVNLDGSAYSDGRYYRKNAWRNLFGCFNILDCVQDTSVSYVNPSGDSLSAQLAIRLKDGSLIPLPPPMRPIGIPSVFPEPFYMKHITGIKHSDIALLMRQHEFIQSLCPNCRSLYDFNRGCFFPKNPIRDLPYCRFGAEEKEEPFYNYPVNLEQGEDLQYRSRPYDPPTNPVLGLSKREYRVLAEAAWQGLRTGYTIEAEIPMRVGAKFWAGDTRWKIAQILNPMAEASPDSLYQSAISYKRLDIKPADSELNINIPFFSQSPYHGKDNYILRLGSTALVLECIGKRVYRPKKKAIPPPQPPRSNPEQPLRRAYLYRWDDKQFFGVEKVDKTKVEYCDLSPLTRFFREDGLQVPVAYKKGKPCFLAFRDSVGYATYRLGGAKGPRVFGHYIEADLYYFKTGTSPKKPVVVKRLKLYDRQQVKILGREFYVRVSKYNNSQFELPSDIDYGHQTILDIWLHTYDIHDKANFYEVELIEGKGISPPPLSFIYDFITEPQCKALGGALKYPEKSE